MSPTPPTEQFVSLLATNQSRLFAYVLSLLPDRDAARDILQETNLELWRQRETFRGDAAFSTWAFKIAYFKVLSHVRDSSRDRHVFDERLIAQLEPAVAAAADQQADRLDALARCVSRLPDHHRSLIRDRFTDSLSIAEIAHRRRKTSLAISQSLFRIRHSLLECIRRRLAEGHA